MVTVKLTAAPALASQSRAGGRLGDWRRRFIGSDSINLPPTTFYLLRVHLPSVNLPFIVDTITRHPKAAPCRYQLSCARQSRMIMWVDPV